LAKVKNRQLEEKSSNLVVMLRYLPYNPHQALPRPRKLGTIIAGWIRP
jgi:hypothetical protein